MKISVHSTAELPAAAQRLRDFDRSATFYVFEGQMGAGKTTFIKELCGVLGVEDVVSSPTFSIVNVYQGRENEVFHFDFYRLKNLEEAYDIGYEEYFYGGGICLLEWSERVLSLLPERYIEVKIDVMGDTDRVLTFTQINSQATE